MIPEPEKQTFRAGIAHPALYLWDAWSTRSGDTTHLYCLAVSRQLPDGTALEANQRNHQPFHIRHFSSQDGGASWRDLGVFQRHGQARDRHDERTIWSGSVMQLADGRWLFGYTGIRDRGPDRLFVQNLACVLAQDSVRPTDGSQQLLLCPERDRDYIESAGYYLGDAGELGSNQGEAGGPILAWRDPFMFYDLQGELMMVWAAKNTARQNAMGLARLTLAGDTLSVAELYPPVQMPDSDEYSQLEVPKIYPDSTRNRYLLVIAASTRQSEQQPDEDVEKTMRIYYGNALRGSWHKGARTTSVLGNTQHLFGMTVLAADWQQQRLCCIAPTTERADKPLTFAPRFEVDITDLGGENPLRARAL